MQRKSLTIKVKDPLKAEEVLRGLNIQDIKTSTTGEVKIYDNVKIVDVVNAINDAGLELLAIRSNDESVEDYYLNLVKEAR